MGIFSLFGKKESQSARKSERDSSQKKRDKDALTADTKMQSEQVQRAARAATAMKIDEIESEMSSEFVKPLPFSGNTMPGEPSQFLDTVARTVPNTAINNTRPASSGKFSDTIPLEQTPTLPMMGDSTAFLLGAETLPGPVAVSTSEAAPVIEEAAILFANGQMKLVEPILLHAIGEEAPPMVWGMLFDLYQITGQRISFENLSIDYAHKFEMSPPCWIEGDGTTKSKSVETPRTGVTPGVAFSGKLDSSIVKQLERIKNMAGMSNTLKLEFARVADVDPVGCGLLLSVLKKLQKSGHNLILVGAAELAEKIRAILMVGRRDETEAPWLLMLELLRLLNRETEFEESAIDYCVTFEVSPPTFVSPQNKVITDTEESSAQDDEDASERFALPAVIDGNTAALLKDIAVYAQSHDPVLLDCSSLTRMDFNAAGQLFNGLGPLIGGGKRIELYHPNHFIIALCGVMGFKDLLHIIARKS